MEETWVRMTAKFDQFVKFASIDIAHCSPPRGTSITYYSTSSKNKTKIETKLFEVSS